MYDAIIIGAGMSGMAAGIRLSMYGKKALILEKHSISGGLNSYYQRGKREFDVGLHALTNFAHKGERKRPLSKLLKQLRIPYEDLELHEQSFSQIVFPDHKLKFNNDWELLLQEVSEQFPDQTDGFLKLLTHIQSFNETSLQNEYLPAKEVVHQYITDPALLEMIFCPLLIYGSAWEDDMDFSQFVIMFKSIFLEGFARPNGGVRKIIQLLHKKLKDNGCEVRFKTGVEEILTHNNKVVGVRTDKGEEIKTSLILSSAGLPETMTMTMLNSNEQKEKSPIGRLSFTETILCLDKLPHQLGQNSTITFYNNRPQYIYRRPQDLYDDQSAVICFPNNFKNTDNISEGIVRLTFMANYDRWRELERKDYLAKKKEVLARSTKLAKDFLPKWDKSLSFHDVFTPTTITKYTSHYKGTVYGSPEKLRDGKTQVSGLCLCGTDQGFLGIVGSMLSGISMANLYGLMEAPTLKGVEA